MKEKPNKHQESARAFVEACRVLPGGVNSPVRAFGGVLVSRASRPRIAGWKPATRGKTLSPVFVAGAKGSKVFDIDGNEYIDYVGSWGPMIVGHAHPKVIEAVEAAARKGTSFGAPTLAETELAKKIIDAFDSIEKVRLLSSGTEAVMTAIRLARGHTKKDIIIKMAGCYHGHSDSLLVAAGSGLAESAIASSAGVPDAIAKLTVVVPYNDIESVKAALAKHKDNVAAILIEPVGANMGVVPPVDGYLETIRQMCTADGVLLIFDEVITGFRLAYGGAQELFGISADLTCLGKIIGGGLPAAAVGGRADIMDILAPTGPVYQAGTLSGNPIATAAANATLDILAGEGCYEKLESSAAKLEAGLAETAKDAGVAVTINRVGSILSCFFTDRPVRTFADVQSTNIQQFKKFFAGMLERGIYLAPSAYEAMFVSMAHSTDDVDRTIEAARASFREIGQ